MAGALRIAALLASLAAAALLFTGTRALDSLAAGAELGPGFWPRLVLAGFGLACLARLVVECRRIRRGAAAAPGGAGGPAGDTGFTSTPAPAEISGGTLSLGMALIVLYVLGAPVIGFPLSTAGFITAFMALAGARSPVGIGTSTVFGTIALVYVFIKLVYLPLPKGAGHFESLTIALYRALGIF